MGDALARQVLVESTARSHCVARLHKRKIDRSEKGITATATRVGKVLTAMSVKQIKLATLLCLMAKVVFAMKVEK